MKNWWIGCSGFYYKGWKERFYPPKLPQRKWFEYYCQFFNTVELNVTFYRFPKLETLQGWYVRSPERFKFTVKAPRLITHYKRFNDASREANDFYGLVKDGLREKLGTVLFQLPPGIPFSQDNLYKIIDVLDPDFNNVIEFRHVSWWNDEVMNFLRKENVTFCSISYPNLPDGVYRTSPVLYYRFHGVPQLYRSPYSDQELASVSKSVEALPNLKDVYCYFNNDIDVAAVHNARTLQRMAGQPVADDINLQ